MCRKDHRFIIESGQCRFEAIDKKRIKIGGEITEQERMKVQTAVEENSDCFGEKLHELGKCNLTQMEIVLESNKPIMKKPYKIPFAKRAAVDTIIEEL